MVHPAFPSWPAVQTRAYAPLPKTVAQFLDDPRAQRTMAELSRDSGSALLPLVFGARVSEPRTRQAERLRATVCPDKSEKEKLEQVLASGAQWSARCIGPERGHRCR